MFNSINEECGVFGVYNLENAAELTYFGLQALQHRGQEGCGIVSVDDSFHIHKGEGLVSKVFTNNEITNLTGNKAIGHVRYSTTGESQLLNVQPFVFHSHDESFGLCHNGNIVNANEVKQELEIKGSIFQSTSDSEIIAHLLKRTDGSFIKRLQETLPKLVGAYAFIFIKDDAMYAACDQNGMRPLSIAKKDQGYIISSETCTFSLVDATHLCDIKPGEIVKINDEGLFTYSFSKEVTNKLCAMEYIYFSRPDSNLRGDSVYQVRERTGMLLAKQSSCDADIVIGVPDSGLAAARGYAKESNLIYEQGLVKNKYSGRTFIQPTDELRKLGIRLKLSVVSQLVYGKRVVVIDDSIVRGFTMKKIIELLKQAGAKTVHVKIASPEIMMPCFYGVDYSTKEQLISGRMNNQQLCDFLEADSLEFLSISSLESAVGVNSDKQLCLACFNGVYPTKLFSKLELANKEIK